MAIVFTQLATASAVTTNATSYTGTAGTPAAGDFLLCFVSTSGLNASGSMTGGGWTWTNIKSFRKNTNADSMNVFWAFASAATSTAPVFSTGGVTATGCIIYCVRITGLVDQTSFTNSIVQTATGNTGTTTNPSVTFAASTTVGSGVIVFGANGTNSTTQWTAPTGFTEMAEAAYSTPTNSAEIARLAAVVTPATTYTWTNANTTPWGTLAFEFKPSVGGGNLDPMGRMGIFGI